MVPTHRAWDWSPSLTSLGSSCDGEWGISAAPRPRHPTHGRRQGLSPRPAGAGAGAGGGKTVPPWVWAGPVAGAGSEDALYCLAGDTECGPW